MTFECGYYRALDRADALPRLGGIVPSKCGERAIKADVPPRLRAESYGKKFQGVNACRLRTWRTCRLALGRNRL